MSHPERILNRLSDLDALWWPLLAWRPAPHEKFTVARSARIVACLWVLATALAVTANHLLGNRPLWLVTVVAMVVVLVLGVAWQSAVAWAWNRRAARLAAGRHGVDEKGAAT